MANTFTQTEMGYDCYGIKYRGVSELDFSIYNRYGVLVFHTTDPHGRWDGR